MLYEDENLRLTRYVEGKEMRRTEMGNWVKEAAAELARFHAVAPVPERGSP